MIKLQKVLIANRGEIACRIMRTAKSLGLGTVAVYSDADAKALHVRQADEAVHIGPSPATESYLRIDRILAAAQHTGADCIHPGYGFLAENADFAEACVAARIKFIGPSAAAMRALGGKAAAKEIAIKAGVPVVPGYQGEKQDAATLTREGKRIGYPVMIKAVAGGGGRGMRLVEREADLANLLESAQREAQSSFGNARVLIEKVVVRPRHIEVQVFGDAHGNVVHMFERDCSLQRRNQKVIEEAPAPGMTPELRERMCAAAVKLAKAVGYEGAGTVEFLVEGSRLSADAPWYFIEMNTRLQVEHPVTEEVTGLDLVEWQLRVASGETLPRTQAQIEMHGHAVEARLCAEDPAQGFMPSVGRIEVLRNLLPGEIRLESGVTTGDLISPFYDSMVAKIIAKGENREIAVRRVREALGQLLIGGIKTNGAFLSRLLQLEAVASGSMDTGLIAAELSALTAFQLDANALEDALGLLLRDRTWSALDLHRREGDRGDPWSTFDGFSLGPPRRQVFGLLVEGHLRQFDMIWREIGPSLMQSRGANRSTLPLRMHGPDAAKRIFAVQDLNHIEIAWPTYDADTIDDGASSDSIRAPINGRVAKVFVKAGDTIEKGGRIAIVEAMKMEHVLHASRSGTVDKVAVSEGQQVTQNTLIAALVET